MAFDKNQELAEGYQRWWDTDEQDWDNNQVGNLLAANVKLIDEDGTELASTKADVLTALKTLKDSTVMDPDSVEVFTSADGRTSIGSDREQMLNSPRRSGWHTCFDKFEWNRSNPPKITAIYVCIADSVH